MIADLNLTVIAGGASMTMLEENLAIISLNTATGVELYSFDLTTSTLIKLGTLADATDLVGLSLVEGIAQPEEEELMPFGYVTTEDGSAWVSIDVETLELTMLTDYSDVVYDGAGMGHDGMMYASADGKYVQIDTANDFAVTTGGDTAYSMTIKDGAPSAPAQELELVDTKSGETKTATVGGYMYYGAEDWGSPYTVKLLDFDANTTKQHSNYKYDDAMAEAMAFLSAEQADASYFNEYYLVLAGNGDLYKHTEQSRYYGGTFGYQRSAEMIADLNLTVIAGGASMTMLNETLALISLNGEDGVTLYTYDLETEELTELGVLEGVTDLVGLTMPASEEEEEEEAQAANKVTGSTMTAAASESGETVEIAGEEVTIADGNVTINLHKESTNGKLIITFDPAELSYVGMTSASVHYSVNDSEAAQGKLTIAYAAASAISAEDILATLSFTYDSEYVDTVVNIATEELNEDADVNEAVDIVVSNALSDDNTLASLTVQEGELSPIFAPTVTEYTMEVSHDVDELTVTAVANDEKATVVVQTGEFDEDGKAVVTITVTAENGDIRVYTIRVTREAAPEDPVYLVNWVSGSTTLGGTINLNFYVKLSANIVNDPTAFVRFTYAGNTVDVPMAEAVVSEVNGVVRYRFGCELYAKQIADTVTAQVMNENGPIGEAKSYSVMQYCLNKIAANESEEIVALAKAMLNYGAAAQVLFGYNTDNLANASLSEADKALADVDASAYKYSITGSEAGIKAKSATLMLESVVKVRVYFTLTGDKAIEDYTFTIDGKEVTPKQNAKGYYVETDGIAAKDLEKLFSFQVGGITVNYGALSYVNSKAASANAEEANMVKALFAYYQAAEAYFAK